MIMDHVFYNIGWMFDRAWLDSGKLGAEKAVDAAQFYWEGVPVPVNYMWLADCAIFLLFIVFCICAYFAYGRKKADLQRFFTVAAVSGVIVLTMCLVNSEMSYDLATEYGLRDWVHNFVLWIFFALCGISCFFSHNNVLRTAEIGLCAGLISLATYLGETYLDMGSITVRYGVLHMLATAVAIFTALQLVCNLLIKDKTGRKFVLAGLCFAVGTVSYVLYRYYFTAEVIPNNAIAFLHDNFCERSYRSSDYFDLLQHLPMVMYGCAIAPFLYPDKKTMLPHLDRGWHKPVCFMGRHTLIVVLLHQLVITGVLAVISYLFITPGYTGL